MPGQFTRNRLRTIGALGLLGAASCAYGAVVSEPSLHGADPSSTAHVFILRSSSVVGAAVTLPVEIDGTTVMELGSGEFGHFRVAPGPHLITVAMTDQEKTERLIAEPQGRYFFEFEMGFGSEPFRRLDTAEGERKIATGHYEELSR